MSPEEELQALKKEKQDLRAKLTEVSEALAQMTQRVAELEARLLMALCSSCQLRAECHVSSKNRMYDDNFGDMLPVSSSLQVMY